LGQKWWKVELEAFGRSEAQPFGLEPKDASSAHSVRLALIAFRPYWIRPNSSQPNFDHLMLVLREPGRVTWTVWNNEESLAGSRTAEGQSAVSRKDIPAVRQILERDPESKSVEQCDVLRCAPLTIPKPWGHEVWYTGVETRGVCQVCTPNGSFIPLPHLELALGMARPEPLSAVPLLKELAPAPHAFLGELYTELHEEKSEVYVVTSIDPNLYPGGMGRVRLGFEPPWGATQFEELRQRLHSYEAARLEVDAALAARGAFLPNLKTPNSSGSGVSYIEHARSLLDINLVAREQTAYMQCAHLYRHIDLKLGDVVRVPKLTPHALQSGVRVVEFQTPHYERKILSSNQKVLTQSGWDIDAALDLLDPVASTQPTANMICSFANLFDQSPGPQFSSQPVVAFDGLFVRGFTHHQDDLPRKHDYLHQPIPLMPQAAPQVCIVFEGTIACHAGNKTTLIAPGEACLLPRSGCVIEAAPLPSKTNLKVSSASNRVSALIGSAAEF
jgi:hypothetical protein